MRSALTRVLRGAADSVFPPRCRSCGGFLSAENRPAAGAAGTGGGFQKRLSGLLCSDCLADYTPVRSPLCTRCGTMFEGRAGEDHLCGRCLLQAPAFSRARAAGIYDGPLLALVHEFKYRACTELAGPLSGLMLDAFNRYWKCDQFDAVVAVPLHGRRRRRRGFNQAALLIRTWSRDGIGKNAPGPFLSGALIRRRPTVAQTGLGRRQRAANIRGAFSPAPDAPIAGLRLLLVDDVLTTGATANECSRVLISAGAKRVCVLTLARSMTGESVGSQGAVDPGRENPGP